MPRGMTAAQLAAAKSSVAMPVAFVFVDVPPAPVRLWDGVGTATVLGQTWQGVGEFGMISGLESSRELRGTEVSLTLHGIPSDTISGGIVAGAQGVAYQGREVTIWEGFADPETGVPLADPVEAWSGFADVITYQIGETVSATLRAEPLTYALRATNGFRMTVDSHNQLIGRPATVDLFFEPATRLMGRPVPFLPT